MIQRIIPAPTAADWSLLLAHAEDTDGATLIGPGWTARRITGANTPYILLRGEPRPVAEMHAKLCG